MYKGSMRTFIIVLFGLLLSGCTATKAFVAIFEDTDDFRTFEKDPRVKFEPGAEINAQIVSESLDESIESIEKNQYRKFAKPVVIYVTASEESYFNYCVNRSGGCVLNERLFISPKKENTAERIPRVLAHELSHLHMEQMLGMWKWNMRVPSWFREGLAVYASAGAGAENVSIAMAKQAIESGICIEPNTEGSLIHPRSASYFGLDTHMFYRQAGLFVSWLHEQNNDGFKELILNIQSGQEFEQSVVKAYGIGIEASWNKFKNEMQVQQSTLVSGG